MLLKLLNAPFGMLAGRKRLEWEMLRNRSIMLTCQSGKDNQPGTNVSHSLPDLEKKISCFKGGIKTDVPVLS